ncbi:hypothetical protein ACQKWADRAFT_295407 [Trichoderma austrokoningii]
MAFVSHIPYLLVQQHPQQMPIQYPTIVVPQPQPQFLQLLPPPPPPLPPVSIMVPTMVVAQQPPLFFMASSAQPSSSAVNLPRGVGITLRIIFYGHASNDGDDDGYIPPLCVSSAIYEAASLPSRDALLAGIAVWAGHHGLVIKHAGGRIDPFRVKLYVLPKSSSSKGVLYGIEHESGVGLVVPGDVVRVVRLGGIEEKDWEGALEEIKREGYGAVVAVDMGEAASTVSTPDPAVAVST